MKDFMLDIEIQEPSVQIRYRDKLMLVGSCFTEHIGHKLEELKFDSLQNPNGILFDPLSVSNSLLSYVQNKQYSENDLFQLNELWQSWQHHSRFSKLQLTDCLSAINLSQQKAHEFLQQADWLIITLGTAYSYRLNDSAPTEIRKGINATGSVANCHRAPGQWFDKYLMKCEEIIAALDICLHQLFGFNPALKVIFTVSPVRHIRDGVINNNRSKARLIESVHQLVNKFDRLYYFPAYELVIDVLRDYRFYDIDLVHPNYSATQFVFDKFFRAYVDEPSRLLANEVQQVVTARKHKAFQPSTEAHRKFLQSHWEKTIKLMQDHPFLNLLPEQEYFERSLAQALK